MSQHQFSGPQYSSLFHNTALTGFRTALKVDRHVAFFLTAHTVVLLLKGVQEEEKQGAVGGEEEGPASDEEDEQEGGSNDEEGGGAVAAQADIVPESPCPSKHSEVLLSPAPSKRSSKPVSPGQASPQTFMFVNSPVTGACTNKPCLSSPGVLSQPCQMLAQVLYSTSLAAS